MPERSRSWFGWLLVVLLVNGGNLALSLRLDALVRDAAARAEASRVSAARARAGLPPPPAVLFVSPRAHVPAPPVVSPREAGLVIDPFISPREAGLVIDPFVTAPAPAPPPVSRRHPDPRRPWSRSH